MPTTYTHDLFGKQVYKNLPEEMRQVIRKHGDLYRIGLHGPDVLFYYMVSKNPVSRFGIKMHEKNAKEFFEKGMEQVRKTNDEPLFAYLLGFGCHYLLDSACHPYVELRDRQRKISHADLETEFDRYLMQKSGKDPYSYRPSDSIAAKMKYAQVIHRAIPEIRTVNLYLSMKMMKFLTNFTICNDGGKKHRLADRILALGGKKIQRELAGHFMAVRPVRGSRTWVRELDQLFEKELRRAPGELLELYDLFRTGRPLSKRWEMNYTGKL